LEGSKTAVLEIRLDGGGEVDRLDVRIALCSIIDNLFYQYKYISQLLILT
jgi:hypothetical protein